MNTQTKKEYDKKYRLKHRERIYKQTREWYKTEKGKIAHKKSNKKQHIFNKQVLHSLKINGCAICGYNKCDRTLEFHHANPQDKKFQIVMIHMGKADLIDEINKCILLCANCHREIEEEEEKWV